MTKRAHNLLIVVATAVIIGGMVAGALGNMEIYYSAFGWGSGLLTALAVRNGGTI